MTDVPFASSRLKLSRATGFISELEQEFIRYCESAPAQVYWDFSQGEPKIGVTYKGLDPVTSAIIGDAIHNIRTSLDLLASELARITSGSDKGVYFPFCESEDFLDEQIKRKNFALCGQDAVALLRSLKPYRNGNDRLRAIHDLDIQDKHQMLVPMIKEMRFQVGAEYALDGSSFGDIDAKVSFRPTFPEGSILAGCHLVVTLKELVQMVDGIIEAFAGLVVARSAA